MCAIQQSDSVMCVSRTHTHIYTHTFFFYIIFNHSLSQETGCSSLCYTVGSHCLSLLNVILCIYLPQTPSPSHFLPLPLGNHKSVLHVCESISVLLIDLFVPYIRFHVQVILYGICLSLSDLLHLVWESLVIIMLL